MTASPSGRCSTDPIRVRIGVTGHRSLSAERSSLLGSKVSQVLQLIEAEHLCHDQECVVVFEVISPLAEGADRLVVERAREFAMSADRRRVELVAVLPLAQDDYIMDFERPESRSEFLRLLGSARDVVTLGPFPTRVEAYMGAGRYVVDGCEVLIAIWDGNSSKARGGTADVMAYARTVHKPTYWIHSETGEVEAFDLDEKKAGPERGLENR